MLGLVTRLTSTAKRSGPLACISISAFLGIVGSAPRAEADLSACGDINVEAQAMCTVIPPSAQCETMCTPVSVRAACRAKLAADCDIGCDELPSVQCSGSCYADCEADCRVDPGKFNCEASCNADCSGRCAASCSANPRGGNCMAECTGSCSVSCRKSCDVELPSADCRGKCEAGCEGSCKVETNIDCQAECQAEGYVDCEAEVTGGCKTRCQSREGALFCDGQFVDYEDNLQMCVDALRAVFDANVDASASGDADCEGDTCEASGRASVSSDCTTAGPGTNPANLWALFALISAMLAYMLRVRTP